MKREKPLFLFSVVVIVCGALAATFAQAQSSAQMPRLQAKHTVKPAHTQINAAAAT
jgi:hypothetical protein